MMQTKKAEYEELCQRYAIVCASYHTDNETGAQIFLNKDDRGLIHIQAKLGIKHVCTWCGELSPLVKRNVCAEDHFTPMYASLCQNCSEGLSTEYEKLEKHIKACLN